MTLRLALLAALAFGSVASCGGSKAPADVADAPGLDDASADIGDDTVSEDDVQPPDDTGDFDAMSVDIVASADVPRADAPGVDIPFADAGPPPRGRLNRVHLHINLGDSVGAGFNAGSGRGFSAMLYSNNAAYPAYAGHDFRTLWPAIVRRDLASSGATSTDVLSSVRGGVSGLPLGADGDDTIVTLNAGGNDLNDNILTVIDRGATTTAANTIVANYNEIFRLLRMRYQDTARGRELVVLASNVYDPTDGTGRIPATFTSGFCRALQNPLLTDPIRMMAVMNQAYFNSRMAMSITSNGGHLVDHARIFIGHGMNGGAARWLDTDCAHPIDIGHHEMRREWFFVLTGERY